MGTKIDKRGNGPSPAARARIVLDLRRGDQRTIAEAVGTAPEYVKQILRYRPKATSALAARIWQTAERLLDDRGALRQSMRPPTKRTKQKP